jgi:hypothetical protein
MTPMLPPEAEILALGIPVHKTAVAPSRRHNVAVVLATSCGGSSAGSSTPTAPTTPAVSLSGNTPARSRIQPARQDDVDDLAIGRLAVRPGDDDKREFGTVTLTGTLSGEQCRHVIVIHGQRSSRIRCRDSPPAAPQSPAQRRD